MNQVVRIQRFQGRHKPVVFTSHSRFVITCHKSSYTLLIIIRKFCNVAVILVQCNSINDIMRSTSQNYAFTKRSVNLSTGNLENDVASDTVSRILRRM